MGSSTMWLSHWKQKLTITSSRIPGPRPVRYFVSSFLNLVIVMTSICVIAIIALSLVAYFQYSKIKQRLGDRTMSNKGKGSLLTEDTEVSHMPLPQRVSDKSLHDSWTSCFNHGWEVTINIIKSKGKNIFDAMLGKTRKSQLTFGEHSVNYESNMIARMRITQRKCNALNNQWFIKSPKYSPNPNNTAHLSQVGF